MMSRTQYRNKVPGSEIQGGHQAGCPNAGRDPPKFNSKSLRTPYPMSRTFARLAYALGRASSGKNVSLLVRFVVQLSVLFQVSLGLNFESWGEGRRATRSQGFQIYVAGQ